MDYDFSTTNNMMEEEISQENLNTEMACSNSQKDSMNEEHCVVFLSTQLRKAYEEENVVVHEIVQSLSDELDDIENSALMEYDEMKVEDDYFFDALDNDDFFVDATQSGDKPSQESFDCFERMLNGENFEEAITVPVNKNVGEIILMVLKYALVHALSLTEITDLFMLINCIFAFNILPNTRYLIDELFYPKSCTELHATCTKCGAYISQFTRKDRSLKCEVCKSNMDVKDYTYQDFFVMLDIASPISKLIESNSEYYNYVVNERTREKNIIRDIYDGKRYRKFVKSFSAADKHRYATVVFNTDGAPLFKSSTYSIWPIYLMVNELPYYVRTKELILVGLWFGKSKPIMNGFLGPFVEKMHSLSTKGVKCTINGAEIFIKIFALICCVDSVARAPVPKERNVEDTFKHMKRATASDKPVFGVKGPSPLINCLISKKMISEIDRLLSSFKAPRQVVRLTRLFSDKEFWKAREWENWTLFYSLPILRNILPTKFLIHWAFFVEGMYVFVTKR